MMVVRCIYSPRLVITQGPVQYRSSIRIFLMQPPMQKLEETVGLFVCGFSPIYRRKETRLMDRLPANQRCGMGCNSLPVNGGFYCGDYIARWEREAEDRRRKEVEAQQSGEIQKLRDEVAELKRKLEKGQADG